MLHHVALAMGYEDLKFYLMDTRTAVQKLNKNALGVRENFDLKKSPQEVSMF